MKSETYGKMGFRIGPNFLRPDPQLVEKLRVLGTPALSDGMNRFNTMDFGIRPILENCRIAGPALTIRLRPGDNLMLHKGLGEVTPGDVVVVDTCGCTSCSTMGDLMATAAFQAGAAGVIIDGGIRDVVELKTNRYPVFARCVTPSVGDKDGPGEINIIISCGGVPVQPGDIIVADDNGIVVIPQDIAEQVYIGASSKLAYEQKRREAIKAGVIVKPEIDHQLREKGVIP